MQNSILVKMGDKPFTVLLVHRLEFESVDKILDRYAEFGGFDRSKLSGHWINTIDITDVEGGVANHPTAKNPWKPQEENPQQS